MLLFLTAHNPQFDQTELLYICVGQIGHLPREERRDEGGREGEGKKTGAPGERASRSEVSRRPTDFTH